MRVAVLTVSDRVAAGARDDAGGSAVRAARGRRGQPRLRAVVADEREPVTAALRAMAADAEVVLTTAAPASAPATSPPKPPAPSSTARPPASPRPCASQPGHHPFAMLSRATAGLVGRTLVVNLPGNPKAVREEGDPRPVLAHARDGLWPRPRREPSPRSLIAISAVLRCPGPCRLSVRG